MKKSWKIGDLLDKLDKKAPLSAAESWDPVGLLVGSPEEKTASVVIAGDLTLDVIRFAESKGARLVINHHPCIFPKGKGLGRFISGTPAFEAARCGIQVAALHTNFDRCALEVVQSVSKGLGACPMGRLSDGSKDLFYKLVTFVPRSHIQAVQDAIFQAGAAQVGPCRTWSFRLNGESLFEVPSRVKSALLKQKGKLRKSSEIRLEVLVVRGLWSRVLAALHESHPDGQNARYDCYVLEQLPSSLGLCFGIGYGFWGEFPERRVFSEVAKDVKRLFCINGFWITNPKPEKVKRIAFAAGKGSSFVQYAAELGCDLTITGEAGYHTALGASQQGMAVLEVGHRQSEVFFIKTLKRWLEELRVPTWSVFDRTQEVWI